MSHQTNRTHEVHAFLRGDLMTSKIASAVRDYIIKLEKENNEWKERINKKCPELMATSGSR